MTVTNQKCLNDFTIKYVNKPEYKNLRSIFSVLVQNKFRNCTNVNLKQQCTQYFKIYDVSPVGTKRDIYYV